MASRTMRRQFAAGMYLGLRVVRPVLSFLVISMAVLGIAVGMKEGWSLQESIYFAFVSGLTIGYGDLAPKSLLGRSLAIGLCGVLFTALLAGVAAKALTVAHEESGSQR